VYDAGGEEFTIKRNKINFKASERMDAVCGCRQVMVVLRLDD